MQILPYKKQVQASNYKTSITKFEFKNIFGKNTHLTGLKRDKHNTIDINKTFTYPYN